MGRMKRSKQQVSVILNTDTENVGFAGELVTVKPGFARNYLLVGGRADVATPKRKAEREAETAKAAERREQEIAKLQELATAIQAHPMQATLKVGPTGHVFGSLGANDVVRYLKEAHKLTVKTSNVSGVPVKGLGSHTVSVKLGVGVTAELPVEVTAEKTAAPAEEEAEPA